MIEKHRIRLGSPLLKVNVPNVGPTLAGTHLQKGGVLVVRVGAPSIDDSPPMTPISPPMSGLD